MKALIASQPIATENDVALARTRANDIARLLGFAPEERTRIAASVWEIAHNAFVHGRDGNAEFSLAPENDAHIFTIRIQDQGVGMDGLDAMLETRARRNDGNTGLAGVRILSDRFEARSTPQTGTTIVFGHILPAHRDPPDRAAIAEMACGKTPDMPDIRAMFAALHEQNRELLASLVELHRRRDESVQLNRELSDTNRGVVALYAELEENAEQLRQASELKTRFLSNMSHEFRTPLNSILALSRLLIDRIDGDLGAEQEKQVGYIRRAAQDLLELVNDLLDLAKVEAGKTELKPAVFHVDELFSALRGALKPLQANPDVELLFESDSPLPPLFTDEAKLGQILRNLVSNALKFTEAGTVRVSAAATPDGKRMVFSVRDTGIGIAPQDHDLIFEQFTQIDTTLQRHVKGTGLGLPLSRKLATLLGGDISLESLPGQGSCFSLDIAVDIRETPRKCLLVIDDDQTFRYVFRQMIAAEMPYDVIEAVDGADGLKRAREDMPALIILDLQMPRMDGFAVLREIRNDARLQRMPVVISTSLPLTPEMKARLPAGQRLLPKDELSRENLTALLRETFMEDAAV